MAFTKLAGSGYTKETSIFLAKLPRKEPKLPTFSLKSIKYACGTADQTPVASFLEIAVRANHWLGSLLVLALTRFKTDLIRVPILICGLCFPERSSGERPAASPRKFH